MSRRRAIDSIIRARELKEERLLGELGRLERALQDAERRLQDGVAALRRADEAPPPADLRSSWLGVARDYRRRLEQEVFDAERNVVRCREAAHEVRKAAVSAGQERRSAEQIAERRAAAAQELHHRAEVAHLDEIGARTRGSSQSG
jgi:flagellar export protein FliJ